MCGSICSRGGAPIGSRTVPTIVENEFFVFEFWGYACACVVLFFCVCLCHYVCICLCIFLMCLCLYLCSCLRFFIVCGFVCMQLCLFLFVEDEELQSAVFEFNHLLKMSRQLEQESFTLQLETWLNASWRRDISILNAYVALSLNFDLGILFMIGNLPKSWCIQQQNFTKLSRNCH